MNSLSRFISHKFLYDSNNPYFLGEIYDFARENLKIPEEQCTKTIPQIINKDYSSNFFNKILLSYFPDLSFSVTLVGDIFIFQSPIILVFLSDTFGILFDKDNSKVHYHEDCSCSLLEILSSLFEKYHDSVSDS